MESIILIVRKRDMASSLNLSMRLIMSKSEGGVQGELPLFSRHQIPYIFSITKYPHRALIVVH